MPQVASFIINDGASTPVATTFSPIGRDAKTGVYFYEQTNPSPVNKLGAVRIGVKTVRKSDLGASLDEMSSVSYSIWVPTLETLGTNDAGITPAPTVSYAEKARIMFDLAERSTSQERKHTRMFALNLLGSSLGISNIDDLSPMW